jgi:hypothetical protein
MIPFSEALSRGGIPQFKEYPILMIAGTENGWIVEWAGKRYVAPTLEDVHSFVSQWMREARWSDDPDPA